MTELEQNLRSIKDEKDTKILPENIKEGVQIFDVIGTHRGGDGSLNGTPIYGNASFVTIPRAVNYGTYNTSLHFSLCDNYYFVWGDASGSYPYSFVYRINGDYSITEIYRNTSGTYVPNFYTMTAAYSDENNIYCIMSYSRYSSNNKTYLYKFDLSTKQFTNIGTFTCNGSSDIAVGNLLKVPNQQNCYRNSGTFYTFDFVNLTITLDVLSTAGLSLRYQFPIDNRYMIGLQYNTDSWYLIDGLYGIKSEAVNFNTNIPFFDPISMVACKGNNLYRVGSNLAFGELLKTNFIPNWNDLSSHSTYTKYLQPIGNDYYIIDAYLYHFDRETLTLTLAGTYTNLTIDGNALRDIIVGYSYNSPYTQNHSLIITEPNTQVLIGYNINNKFYPNKRYTGASSSTILVGYDYYDEAVNAISGTMPNNGQLNYTPTTSQQTIPAGYTSGGTIGAISISEQEYQEDLDLANDILGID